MYSIYEQQELTKSLKTFINTYTISHNQDFFQIEAREADLKWEASRFWANVIHKATSLRNDHTYENFLVFKKVYEDKNSTNKPQKINKGRMVSV